MKETETHAELLDPAALKEQGWRVVENTNSQHEYCPSEGKVKHA